MREIRRLDNGEVIHSGDFNSDAELLIDGLNKSVSFYRADFRSANFSYANFSSADFSYADFSSADFSSANFRSADFSYANFSSADFSYANFSSVCGDGIAIKYLAYGNYKLIIQGNNGFFGCTKKTLDDWLEHKGEGLNSDDLFYLENITKPFVRMVIAEREAKKESEK